MSSASSPSSPKLLVLVLLLVGCSTPTPSGEQPQARPSFTPPPEDRGSATLTYKLTSEKPPEFSATSSVEIPLFIFIDPDAPKEQAIMAGSVQGEYHVKVAGMDAGKLCFIEFTIPIEYDVNGLFNPNPACDFDVNLTAKVKEEGIQRSGDCSVPVQNSFPAELIFIPPPPGPHKIAGSLLPVPIRKDAQTDITIELKDVVVPFSTGCQF